MKFFTMLQVPNLSLRLGINLRQATKFATVGVLNTSIDLALFAVLFYLLDVPIFLANTVAYCAGVTNSFVWNKHWTFSEHKHCGRSMHQFPIFFALNLVGLGLSNLAVWFLAAAMPVIFAKVCAVGVTFVWNFWSSRRFVYRSVDGLLWQEKRLS